jgi:glycosyltransferase involved in cell wall biosynthesis
VRRLARAVREVRADVVLSTLRWNVTCALAKPLFPRDTALVCRVANNLTGALTTLERSNPTLKQKAVERLHRRVLTAADLVIAQSTSMEADLADRYGDAISKKVWRIPNPVDVDSLLRRASVAPHPAPRPGSPQLVSVGRLHHQKGYDLLLPAFAELLQQSPDARLRILGEGPDRDQLEALVTALGIGERVDLLGFIGDPLPHVAAADLYVCSSRYEGFSNALAEALAVGTPAVAPAGPAAGGDLIDDVSGVLVEAATTAALSEGIAKALALPFDRTVISDSCRRRFSPGPVVERYQEALLAAGGRPRTGVTAAD